MAYIGKTPVIGNFQVCDAISVVNNQAAYTMQVGGVNVSPESANHMLVSLNGILQAPTSSFTVSGSTITFASNLVTGDVIDFIQILGNVLDLGVPSDSTVSLAKLTATGTKDATTFLRGDNTFAAAGGGGITEVDMFRLTANTSGGTNDVISANLERVDDASFSKIGTGMTESSGQFAFPSTGLYHVIANPMILTNGDGNSYIRIELSTDSGSTFTDTLAFVNHGIGTATDAVASVYQSSFVNVTNASTFRIHFKTSSMGAGSYVRGDTEANYTSFKFIRLGDSQ